MKGVLLLDGAQHAGDERFARRHAERAGHEAEVLRGGNDDVLAVELTFGDEHGVLEFRVRLRVLQPVGSSGGRRGTSAGPARPAAPGPCCTRRRRTDAAGACLRAMRM